MISMGSNGNLLPSNKYVPLTTHYPVASLPSPLPKHQRLFTFIRFSSCLSTLIKEIKWPQKAKNGIGLPFVDVRFTASARHPVVVWLTSAAERWTDRLRHMTPPTLASTPGQLNATRPTRSRLEIRPYPPSARGCATICLCLAMCLYGCLLLSLG